MAAPLTIAVSIDHGMHLALCLSTGAMDKAALMLDSIAVVRLLKLQVRVPLLAGAQSHLCPLGLRVKRSA